MTVAERTPRAEDFPGAPPENLVAGSVVFSPPDHPVQLNNHYAHRSSIAFFRTRLRGQRLATRLPLLDATGQIHGAKE